MEVVERFIRRIAWPGPPNGDTHNWEEFLKKVYSPNYASATAEQLKKIAWVSKGIGGWPEEGMWRQRTENLERFLVADMGLSDYNPVERIAIEYDFVACFLNDYRRAEYNEGLWRSVNEAALKTLSESITADDDALIEPDEAIDPKWLSSRIPEILYNAIREIHLSYYRPTEDTYTWSSFQSIALDLTELSRMQFTFRHAYLISNIESRADPGMWKQAASRAQAFLNDNLGKVPSEAPQQFELARKFCQVMLFNYRDAKHNEDLFEVYHNAFERAEAKLEVFT